MAQQIDSIQMHIHNVISTKDNKLLNKINKLYDICFSDFLPGTTFHGNPNKILKILSYIDNNSTDIQLENFGPNKIIRCSVKILSLCDEDFYKTNKIHELKRYKNYKIAKSCYYNFLKVFIPKQMWQVIKIVIEIINDENLWQWEDLCYDLINGLLNNGIDKHNIVQYLLDKAEEEATNLSDAKLIINILNISIFENSLWPNTNETIIIIDRLFNIYRNEINNYTDSNVIYQSLKSSIQLSICKMIANLSDDHRLFIIYQLCTWTIEESINENIILEFSNILEYTTNKQKTKLLKNTITDELFNLIMQMIKSDVSFVSLVGNRVLQYLIDRGKNRSHFETPQIFFENTKYKINIVNNYNEEDKEFLKQHRQFLHDTFINCLMNHSSILLNLESIYCSICLISVEVPCGFSAAAIVCLIMNMQNLTLNQSDMSRDNFNHIHTTIMGIMTLICWIHNANVLYSYVNQVMMERAQWAPHLNPPLKIDYSYASHHILWNKPKHYFVNWEVRFGLWKCFRLHIDKDDNSTIIDKTSENN